MSTLSDRQRVDSLLDKLIETTAELDAMRDYVCVLEATLEMGGTVLLDHHLKSEQPAHD